ncbi:beta-lactamase family protein [bacterium SCSIO 12741]|nr:beta-lactamase family protein [bacterium SCSIO 12741]
MTYWKSIAAFLLITAIFGACTSTSKPSSEPEKQTLTMEKKFQLILDTTFANHPNTKGIILQIDAPDLHLFWGGAVGSADSAGRQLESHFPAWIASNTKTYVAAATLRLIEQDYFSLESAITELISERSRELLNRSGYTTDSINVQHLLSHTSGLFDYSQAPTFLKRSVENPDYHWSRDEQIALAMEEGNPLDSPGKSFSYSEVNYLLLTEIMESQLDVSFELAIRKLLKYEALDLKHTWFHGLEEMPQDLPPLVQQFATQYQVNTYTLHPTFDLYGGGGIAATAKDLNHFTQALFSGQVFDQKETLNKIFTQTITPDSGSTDYRLGIERRVLGKHEAYGHGGFWGTTSQYFPELNASITVFLMERDEWEVYLRMMEDVANVLSE